ncbi:acetyl-CoA C-acyltransferase [Pseudodonghicola xiamenensis]|uniref:Acetyl-CoA acetyltransferase n=1 Tax=Pseudodonghicola xiamenensis TaxID=337702 RepID=A0A8J3MFV7_9RHOB|nr:acetyl-CoA C-acyltransferase [Pseudodonghicola xiamenensis]GHG97157.1 acetyl-CoA acetyltransferase [Pseudodonghicola xiamenensis]
MPDSHSDAIVVVAARRTPLGAFMGALSGAAATDLGAAAIGAAVADAGIDGADVSEVLMGCVLPAGQGQAPARQAARRAQLADAVGATTINKVCGSGMKAVMLGHDLIRAGSADIVVAGGMEAMSRAPFLLPEMRHGHKAGSVETLDHMMRDGLEDAYDRGRPMGAFGEAAAARYGFSRDDQDAYAIETLERARAAVTSGAFDAECTPVTIETRKGAVTVARDERPEQIDPARIPGLRAAFGEDGTITAASSSANADGAAAVILTRESEAAARGMPVMARILGHATHSQEPEWFTTAPIPAIRKLLDLVGWQAGDVDLFEINEAFAVVAMAAARDIGIPRDRLNVNGGACALGHPIGATGARILVTLIHALRARGLRRGVACLCIGGGEATAIAVEVEG